MQKSTMGAVRKKSQNENMGAKMEPGTARLYHMIRKSAMGTVRKKTMETLYLRNRAVF